MSSPSQSAKSTASPSLLNSSSKISSPQIPLNFESETPLFCNDDLLIRAAVAAAFRRSDRSREQIADAMTEMLGVRVTAVMLNTYTAQSATANRMPAAWMRAFCKAAGSDALLQAVAEAAGYRLISGAELELLELGREFLRQKRATDRVSLLEKQLQGVEL